MLRGDFGPAFDRFVLGEVGDGIVTLEGELVFVQIVLGRGGIRLCRCVEGQNGWKQHGGGHQFGYRECEY